MAQQTAGRATAPTIVASPTTQLTELQPSTQTANHRQSTTDDLGIDCDPIRAAMAQRRQTQNFAIDADAEADRLALESPHLPISADTLVDFMMIRDGYGRPLNIDAQNQHKMILKMELCDRLTREIVSRQYAAVNPTVRL